ncbi:hypothetical protein [Parabacteroides sp. AM08-6]|uniref:hypothetical protein n=1 Tax=Parabacteroides sp. AM08-6 TaxID=2292053 RepID=UPI000EFE71D6|nr:hypothetical protein [Parabacteroides sp. AM08-6]RHJ83536.1 hypothetical protein DW103_07365 [Parabacteroides sp. AM08-6]
MAKELTSYDKIEMVLFKGREEAATFLSERELQQKERWMLCVSKLLEDPMTADKDMVSFLTAGCGGSCEPVSTATAYRDMAAIRRLVGNVQLAGKNWYRYMVIEAAKEGIRIAKEAKDPKGIAANADKIGKYTRADKEDEEIDRSGWEPPVFEPSDDVTLMGDGFKPIPNLEEERKSFRALFKNDSDILDVEPITDDCDGADD